MIICLCTKENSLSQHFANSAAIDAQPSAHSYTASLSLGQITGAYFLFLPIRDALTTTSCTNESLLTRNHQHALDEPKDQLQAPSYNNTGQTCFARNQANQSTSISSVLDTLSASISILRLWKSNDA